MKIIIVREALLDKAVKKLVTVVKSTSFCVRIRSIKQHHQRLKILMLLFIKILISDLEDILRPAEPTIYVRLPLEAG